MLKVIVGIILVLALFVTFALGVYYDDNRLIAISFIGIIPAGFIYTLIEEYEDD